MPAEHQPEQDGEEPAGDAGTRDREQHGLADGVEGQRERRADGGDDRRVASLHEAAEEAALKTHRPDHLAGPCAEYRDEVGRGEHAQKQDRDPRPGQLEPFRRMPLPRHRGDDYRHQSDHGAVPERKQQTREPRQPRAPDGVEARHPVDRVQVVGIHPVFQPQDEYERGEREPVVG